MIGALTSRDAEKLRRCCLSVNHEDCKRVILCNTLDKDYIPEAKAVADELGWEFVVSESNGWPGKGKNSMLDYFYGSEAHYLVPLDADDFLNEGALDRIKVLINNYDIDVLGQSTNPMTANGEETTFEDFIAGKVKSYYDNLQLSKRQFVSMWGLIKELQQTLPFNRFIILSKKAVSKFRFQEDMMEDIIAGAELYNLHQKEEINYFLTDEFLYNYEMYYGGALDRFLQDAKSVRAITEHLQKNKVDLTNELPKIN